MAGAMLAFSAWAQADRSPWVGEWNVPKREGYNFVEITKATATQLEGAYNEGVGINGVSFEFKATLTSPTKAKGEGKRMGDKCALTLELKGEGIRRTLTLGGGCELAAMSESQESLTFLPKGAKSYFEASFDCNKAASPVEIAVCESWVLATSDKAVGGHYSDARKSLDQAGQTRLRDAQRAWVKTRDGECASQAKELERCLMRHYGLRQFQLYALVKYGLWLDGAPDFKMVSAVAQAARKKDGKVPSLLDSGLDLWLSAHTSATLQSNLGSLEADPAPELTASAFIVRANYSPNATQGHDPVGSSRVVFIGFYDRQGVWVADKYFEPEIFGPRNSSGPVPSELIKWSKDVEAGGQPWVTKKVFP
jgi:uncharacterized protein YecT (DUF1311 family)